MVTISALKDIVLKLKNNNNNNNSDLRGLFMKGTGGKVGDPRTLFLDPPLQCTVSEQNNKLLKKYYFLVIY